MISKKIQSALNDQLNAEFYAAYLYLGMSACFHATGLNGFSDWMRVHAQEEMMHGMKIYEFLNSRDGKVELKQIDAPPGKWSSTLAAFENALKHEKEVTAQINNLVDLAVGERDHATNVFLQWFVTEQVEEEATIGKIVAQLKLIGTDGNGLFLLDRDMGSRAD